MEFSRLLMVTNDLGVELEWFVATDQPAGVNEAQDVAVLTCVAVRIVDTVGEKGPSGSLTRTCATGADPAVTARP